MDPELLKISATHKKALVLIGFAGGSVPSVFSNTIKELTDQGTAVFIIPDKTGNEHGVLRLTDEPHYEALGAGAKYLEKANIKNEREVYQAIQDAIDEGLSGEELGRAVQSRFADAPEEQQPIPEWEDPARRDAHFKKMRWRE